MAGTGATPFALADAVTAAREAASTHLDRVDSLPVGSGQLQLNLFGDGTLDDGVFGGAASYERRISETLSAFGEGWAGYDYGASAAAWGAAAGARWRF